MHLNIMIEKNFWKTLYACVVLAIKNVGPGII